MEDGCGTHNGSGERKATGKMWTDVGDNRADRVCPRGERTVEDSPRTLRGQAFSAIESGGLLP